MQLFAVTWSSSPADRPDVAGAIRAAAEPFPALAAGCLERGASTDGALEFAAIAHPPEAAAPRRYLVRHADEVVLYDGLPVERSGRFPAWDAEELRARWPQLPDALEGVFCAVRIDLAAARVECLPDPLGLSGLYFHGGAGGWVLGNSLVAVAALAGARSPDPVGLSTFLALGWATGRRTIVRDIDALAGGHVHAVDRHGLRSRPHFTPAGLANARRVRPPGVPARAMVETTAAAGAGVAPRICGLTAGRDSRVLLALAQAAGWDASYYTSGDPHDPEVEIAREVAHRAGVPYRVVPPDLPADEDWAGVTGRFVAQTDGLVSVAHLDDWLDHQANGATVGVKLWGAGGEIARQGFRGGMLMVSQNAWGARRALWPQRAVLRHKAGAAGLLRPAAVETTRATLDDFLRARVAEGWAPAETPEAYYAFERVRRWAAGGARRAASTTDVYSPFVSREYIEWSFSLSGPERFLEAGPWRLLSELSPDLRDFRFDRPWRAQDVRTVQPVILRELARLGAAQVRSRRSGHRPPTDARPHLRSRWIEAGRERMRDLCLSQEASPLWDLVDRRRLEAALGGPQPSGSVMGLCHVLTAFTWFHGLT